MHLHLLNLFDIDDAQDIVYQIRHLAKIFMLFFSFNLLDSVCGQLEFVLCVNFEVVVYGVFVWFLNFLRLL